MATFPFYLVALICYSPCCSACESVDGILYNNEINARALIGQSAVGSCAGKPTEKKVLP